MSTPSYRWLDWEPPQIMADAGNPELTKPPKPSSVSFGSPYPGQFPIIGAAPEVQVFGPVPGTDQIEVLSGGYKYRVHQSWKERFENQKPEPQLRRKEHCDL